MKSQTPLVLAPILMLLAAVAHGQTTGAAAAQAGSPPAASSPPVPGAPEAAPPPPAAAEPSPGVPSPTQGAIAPAPGLIPAPPQGKGDVVFFRPSAFRGAPIWFTVKENGAPLGKLTNGAYFVQVADPGPHTYTAATENKNVLHMEVDPGETYYIRGSIQMGVLIGEADMTPSDQTTFEKAFKKMHLAAPPAAQARAAGDALR